jgi:SAM-dependent methyltransferase
MSVFGSTYAGAYDKLYGEKDYASECDMIEALLALDAGGKKTRLLDLGCGTGNHAIPLALRGYDVTGVDLSDGMLSRAQDKAAAAGATGRTAFHHGDVRTVDLAQKGFDAALMMFAVLGYQQTDADVRAALKTVRAHVGTGAPFIFDVWYGPGVVADKPGPRERVIENGTDKIIRRTNALLDEARHLCTVQFDLEMIRDGVPAGKTQEEHVMRFFFPDELEKFAAECGFKLVTLRNFPDWLEPVSVASWNAVGLLQAV